MRIYKFFKNRGGNVATTTALLALPLLGAAGAAIDYVAFVNAQKAMQEAVDSAALFAARTGGKETPEMEQLANKFFETNLDTSVKFTVNSKTLEVTKTSDGYEYLYQATFERPTSLMSIFGIASLGETITATAKNSVDHLEIAFVLDSTGSMASANKMTELKVAVDTFLDQFPNGSNIRVSVIPFDTQVRLDKVNFGSSNLDDPSNPYEPGADCNSLSGEERSICQSYQASCTASSSHDDDDDDDDEGSSSLPPICSNTAKTAKDNLDISANNDLLGATNTEWTGCVIDRVQPFDVSALPAVPANPDSLYPTSHCATANLQPILPLTKSFSKVKQHVKKMQPSGNTNLTIGVQWGLETLSKASPFKETQKDNPTLVVRQMMVLVTDGQNTQNRWTTDTASIDQRAELACESAKADLEKVFTVRVINGNADLLRNCASTPEYFYDIKSASELETAFEDIANKVTKVALVN